MTDPLIALPGVADAVDEARTVVATLHRHPANLRGWARTAAAASVRAARASAMLDGGSGELDPAADRITDPVLAGSLRAAAAVARLVPVWQRSPMQALATLHTLAAADLPDVAEPGRPVVPGAADRLAGLAGLVSATPWPAPILIAVVHGELLTLRPFGSADGVVARAAARLTMIATGLDPRGLSVPEVGHLRSGARYLDLAAGFASGEPDRVGGWLIEVCRCLVAGAREGSSIADAAR